MRSPTLFKTFIVARREFLSTVTTKGFIIGVLMTPLLMLGAIAGVSLLMNKALPHITGHVAVIDRTGMVGPRLQNAFTPEAIAARHSEEAEKAIDQAQEKFPVNTGPMSAAAPMMAQKMDTGAQITVEQLPPDQDVDAAKAEILRAVGKVKDSRGENLRLALVVIPQDAVKPPPGKPFTDYDFFTVPKLDMEISGDIGHQVSKAVVDARLEAGGYPADKIRALIKEPRVHARAVTAEGEKGTSELASIFIPFGFMLLLWISVFSAGQYLLTSTIEEKSSRVMEVLLSAVSPMQLMVGKILGQMAVGLLILCAYSGLGIAGLLAFSYQHMLDPMGVVYLVIYFIIAFFLIASIMAAIGSAVSDVREAQSLMAPVMIVLVIPMMLWMPIMRNPNSMFAQVCSFLPPISPFIMVLRLSGSEKIATWQVPVSILIGVLSAAVAAWGAAKVFRIGVLMYGKPPNFKTMIRWIRMA